MTPEGRAVRLLPPFGGGTLHIGIDHMFWMDGHWALREREAVGDASVGQTEGGEQESGKRFWARQWHDIKVRLNVASTKLHQPRPRMARTSQMPQKEGRRQVTSPRQPLSRSTMPQVRDSQ